MVIIEGIVHRLALAAELDELAGFQHPQLVTHRTLRDAYHLSNVVDAKLAFKQCIQNFDAGRIAEHAEQLSQIVQHFVIGQVILQAADVGLTQLGGFRQLFACFFAHY